MIVDNDWADCPADLLSFISSDISPAFEPVASQRTGFKVGEIVKLSLLGDNLQFSCVPPGGCESSPADLNGDGKYTLDDRQFLGHQNPLLSFNLRNEFKILKNLDFSFALYARLGQFTQYNEAKNVDLFYDRSQFYKRPYWTPTNPINDYAKMMSAAGGSVS